MATLSEEFPTVERFTPEQLSKLRVGRRKWQTLILLTNGYSNDEIGATLEISPETVKSHVRDIIRITGARNRTHVAAMAALTGIISHDE